MKTKLKLNGQVSDIQASDLFGGNLSMVSALCMLRYSADRNKFMQLVEKEKGKFTKLQENYQKINGYTPSHECLDWARISKAHSKYFDTISNEWYLNSGLEYYGTKEARFNIHHELNDWHFMMAALTGLKMWGGNGGGDSCFLSVLPSPLKTTEVYFFDHEMGRIEHCMGYSLSHFIASNWAEDEFDDYLEEDSKNKKAVDDSIISKKTFIDFGKNAKSALKTRPYYHNPAILFKRTHWIMDHVMGEPTYKFAKKIADAPRYSVWEKELKLISKEPVLANYWLLAHYFLGNENACRKTIHEAKKTPGEISKKLAGIIEKLLEDPKKATLGKLKPAAILKVKLETQKNSLPELLEPGNKIAFSTGESAAKKLSASEFRKRIKSDDPWKLIGQYPLDVELHDFVLKAIAKNQKNFTEVINEFFEARIKGAYHEWPDNFKTEHKKLSLPVAAAFRSGLRYDADHIKAYSGITQTLSKLDDNNTMDAFAEALRILKPDDKRLEYVIEGLDKSKHPRAKEIMRAGAWRYFDHFKELVKAIEETSAEGATLNNMFKVHSHLHEALMNALSEYDEEAEKLADKVLGFRKNLQALGDIIGRALRVAGKCKLDRHTAYAKWYCIATAELKSDEIDPDVCYNLTEAAITYATLAPKEAKGVLGKIFDKKYDFKFFMLDVKGSILGGLLLLDPKNSELHSWTERILGNRWQSIRAFGPLMGIVEAKIKELAPLARPHVYCDHDSDLSLIKGSARLAVQLATGETLPLFDDHDEYASDVKRNNLPNAIKQPEKYITSYVFERINEIQYKHPDIIKNGVEFLLDILSYTSDDSGHHNTEGIWNCIKALVLQGPDSLPGLAKVLELPYVSHEWYTNILYSMRVIEPEADIVHWLLQSTIHEINKQLEKPKPRFMPWLDLLAAYALVQQNEKTKKAIEDAIAFRYQYTTLEPPSFSWEELEPSMIRLPKIYAQIGNGAKPVLSKLLQAKNKNEYAKEYLKESIKNIKQLQTRRNKAIKLSSKGTISLYEEIKGKDSDKPKYSITIKVEGKKLSWRCVVERLYFQDIVEDERLESKKVLVCKNTDEAVKLANVLSEMYAVMGYIPVGEHKQ